MKEILQGTHLNKSFHDGDKLVVAASDVSFTLHEGEFLGIVGESGCGKSTLLRLVSGLIQPDSGELIHNGEVYNGASPAKTGRFLQMIFQIGFDLVHHIFYDLIAYGALDSRTPDPFGKFYSVEGFY